MIDIENKIEAIKVQSLKFLIEGTWTNEQEIIIYWAGTRTRTLGQIDIRGPKAEQC